VHPPAQRDSDLAGSLSPSAPPTVHMVCSMHEISFTEPPVRSNLQRPSAEQQVYFMEPPSRKPGSSHGPARGESYLRESSSSRKQRESGRETDSYTPGRSHGTAKGKSHIRGNRWLLEISASLTNIVTILVITIFPVPVIKQATLDAMAFINPYV
jgi:hypothetical protein